MCSEHMQTGLGKNSVTFALWTWNLPFERQSLACVWTLDKVVHTYEEYQMNMNTEVSSHVLDNVKETFK